MVVVIDDEESIREGLEHLLAGWGCEVISAAEDAEAIKQLSAYARIPDAIVSDFRLRNNRTSLEAIESINAACNAKIPALIVTGDTENEALLHKKSSGWQLLRLVPGLQAQPESSASMILTDSSKPLSR